jgi:MFS family permease
MGKANSRYPWAVVGMLWFICFFNYADRQAIFSIFPLLKSQLGFDNADLGIIGAAFTWIYAITAPMAGQVGDRYSRKIVIIGGLYVWSIVTGFTALCSQVWQFVAVRGAEGLGETFYFPASMSLISDYHSKATRSRAMGLHQTSVYAGTIGGGALAGWIGEHYGWQYPFVVLGAGGVVLGLVLATFIREPQRNQADRMEQGGAANSVVHEHVPLVDFLRELARTPSALLLILAFFGANFVGLVFLTWMPTFLTEKFKLNLAMAGVSATVYLQMASMCGSLLGGLMADWLRVRFAGGRILVQAVGALLGAPFIFLCGYTLELPVLIFAMTFFGLFKGIYDSNIWAALYDVVPPSRRGTAVGLTNMIGWFGGGLGAMAIGFAEGSGITMSEAISSTAVIYIGVACILVVASLLVPRATGKAPMDTPVDAA